jgi:hypothetical protein
MFYCGFYSVDVAVAFLNHFLTVGSSLAYKRPVVYGLKINPYRSHGLKNPYAGAVKHGL